MLVIDTQVHAATLAEPWAFGEEAGLRAATEALLGAMDAVGVDHAIIAPRHDAAMGEYAVTQYPGRLGRVIMLDADAADIDEQVARAKATPGVVALRQVVSDYIGTRGAEDLKAGKFDPLFAAAQRHGIAIFLLAPGHPADLADAARGYPDLTLIVDHFGLRQYPPLSMDPDPWEKLPGLLALSRFPNVTVKFCGAQLLSSEPYPHADVWPVLRRVIDAFGVGRLMWASDFTRLRMTPPGTPWCGTYADTLRFVSDSDQLSEDERRAILGGTAQRILCWPPT
ncbi:MAG: amidohydrolase 2 [Rhodospirillales bacterium]|nr:amidohydrolase 2 [Rhodospirillales bacterium]